MFMCLFTANTLLFQDSYAAHPKEEACKGIGGAPKGNPNDNTFVCEGGNGGGHSLMYLFKQIINVLLFITGMIAVLFIVLGGLRFVTSNGDSNQISQAKQTILYAVIGLVVAILAYAIVNFVVSNL